MAKLLYTFHFSDRINAWEANANGSVIWRTVHYDILFVEYLEYLSSAMPNRTRGIIMCRDVPQRVQLILDVCSVLTPVQLVLSGEDTQYILNQYASLESYNMIYQIDQICWPQQGCVVSSAAIVTCSDRIRARVHVRVVLVSHMYRSWDCPIMSEHWCQRHVYQSRDWQKPCQWPCQRPCQKPCLSWMC